MLGKLQSWLCWHSETQTSIYGADRNTPVGTAFTKLHSWLSVCVVLPDNLFLTDIKSPCSKCYAKPSQSMIVACKNKSESFENRQTDPLGKNSWKTENPPSSAGGIQLGLVSHISKTKQEAQLLQRYRAAACLNFGKNISAKSVHLTLLYVTALTSTNHHFTVLRHHVCT